MRTRWLPWLLLFLALVTPRPAAAETPTAHRLSFQGLARDAASHPVLTGDVRVRIYDASTGGALVYDSAAEFNGVIVDGVFDVVLGSGAALMLDGTQQYFLELDVNGQEVVGDAASGRQAFWPAGGDQTRTDLETRIQSLENLVFGQCSAGEFNLNGDPTDGCEFVLDPDGIYVDANDPGADDGVDCGLGPVGTDAGCRPCRSIAQGLARAVSTSRSKIYVADGIYSEAVTLVNGKSLLGGYHGLTWERHLSSTTTFLRGESTSGSHKRAVVGTSITNPTVVEGFVILGPQNTAVGGNSYAVYLSNCNANLALRSNVIMGGTGGPGADGAAGTAGANGVAGTAGGNAIQSPTSSCSATLNRNGGAGGILLCGATSVNGGAGGGNRCTPVPNSKFSGIDGTAGTGAGGGAAGTAGFDGTQQSNSCFLPNSGTSPMNATAGSSGTAGANGAGAAGASGAGSVVAGHWVGASGGVGAAGAFGRGGGGGGAGGGSDGISPEQDVLGGAGGGGGSGACGGGSSTGGAAGGGSFGIFLTGGVAPTITSNVIFRGSGGSGGRGGAGGKGGAGGTGALGGLDSFLCSGLGARGGDGGAGGFGGGGGGGAGGMSVGICTSGVGSPSYSSNSVSGGSGGAGGPGGPSFGNPGGTGTNGVLTTFQFN